MIKIRRKDLRNNMTPFEIIIWSKIRGRQFFGIKWRRQFSVGKYILDFYSADLNVCLEIDGDSHSENIEYDNLRTNYLNSQGIKVLRYTNIDVRDNINGVLEDMRIKLITPPPSAPPLDSGEGKTPPNLP